MIMNWGAYIALFLASTIKFMFAPFGGPIAKITFFEALFSCAAGAILSSSIFFFSARYFMDRAAKKYQEKLRKSREEGIPFVPKKKFTRMNKFIVRIKRSIGIIGICFWAPLFLSIPLGSIIVAKFYGHTKIAYPLVIVGIFVNGLIITSLAYFVF